MHDYTVIYYKRGEWHETLLRGSRAEAQEAADQEHKAGRHAYAIKVSDLRHGLPVGPHSDGVRPNCELCKVNA